VGVIHLNRGALTHHGHHGGGRDKNDHRGDEQLDDSETGMIAGDSAHFLTLILTENEGFSPEFIYEAEGFVLK
jgi:hypothetical protein